MTDKFHIVKNIMEQLQSMPRKANQNEQKYIETVFSNGDTVLQLLTKQGDYFFYYLIAKETNAKAEALNQNLQGFINVNLWSKKLRLFPYRIKVHFT